MDVVFKGIVEGWVGSWVKMGVLKFLNVTTSTFRYFLQKWFFFIPKLWLDEICVRKLKLGIYLSSHGGISKTWCGNFLFLSQNGGRSSEFQWFHYSGQGVGGHLLKFWNGCWGLRCLQFFSYDFFAFFPFIFKLITENMI